MPSEISRLNPAGLHDTPGYHHVTVATGGRLAFLAGQCPVDPDGKVVGAHDVLAQVDQVVSNAMTALAAVGAVPEHVVRSVIYVVTAERTVLADVWTRFRASPLAAGFTTASTLLGVAQLGYPGQLVELDLTAVLPD